MTSDRRGMAIVVVLVAMLAGTALAHGVLLLARSELVAARSRATLSERSALETVALGRVVRAGLDPAARATELWGARPVPDSAHRTPLELRVRRVGTESWWLEVSGRPDGGRRPGSAGRLLWWMDPMARVAALGSVVTVGAAAPVSVAGRLDGAGFGLVVPPLTAERCAPFAGGLPEGWVPSALGRLPEGGTRPSLGLLLLDALLGSPGADSLSGSGAPGPDEAVGVCAVGDPWNWGDPDSGSGPCGDRVPAIAAPAGLVIEGGMGQAALAVEGDLVLSGDARIHGFALVSGALRVLDRAEFHGQAVAAGGLEIGPGASVLGSACWAARALTAAVPVWAPRPLPVPGLPPVGP